MTTVRWKNAFRVAFRSLVAARWNAAAAVLVLSVAAAAGHAVSAIWNSTVERPLSWRNADEIVAITVDSGDEEAQQDLTPYPSSDEVALLDESAASLDWIGTQLSARFVVGGSSGARLIHTAQISPGTLEALGASPVAGRRLNDADHQAVGGGADAAAPVLLRADLASFLFGSPEAALGGRVELGRRRTEVIGVMPNDFLFPRAGISAWLPMPPQRDGVTQTGPTYARLAPGASPESAAAEATAILRRAEHRSERERVVLTPLTEGLTERIRPTLEVLRAGALLLLIAAAAGVASLRLSQALAEQRSSGIRRALGATAGDEIAAAGIRIVLLAGVVAGGALAVSAWLLPLLRGYGSNLLFADEWTAGGGAAIRAFAAALVAVTLAEIPSLLEILRERSAAITSGARGAHGRRPFLLPLLAAGTAASTVVLVATTVLSGSAWALLGGRGGYADADLAILTVDFGGRGAGEAPPVAERRRILDALVDRIEALPAVRSAAYADGLPDDPAGMAFSVEDSSGNGGQRLAVRRGSAGLLGVLQIPVLRGRGLLDSDRTSGEIIGVVDRTFAERSAEDPLDSLITVGGESVRVVGIAADVLTFPARDRWSTIYRPFDREPAIFTALLSGILGEQMEVVARLDGGASAERLAVLAALPKEVDPSLRALGAQTVRDRRTGLLGASALASVVLLVFAAAGLLLTVVGVVGHIADTTAREAQPNAIRLALGAEPAVVVWQVARRTGLAAAAGIGSGLLLGWLLARAIGSRIPWVETGDLSLYLGPVALTALLMAAGGLYAGLRAARSNPWALLRSL